MRYLHIQVPVTPEGDNKGSADWEIENKCDGVFRGQELIRWTIQELIDRNAKPTIVIGGKKPNQTQNLKVIVATGVKEKDKGKASKGFGRLLEAMNE